MLRSTYTAATTTGRPAGGSGRSRPPRAPQPTDRADPALDIVARSTRAACAPGVRSTVSAELARDAGRRLRISEHGVLVATSRRIGPTSVASAWLPERPTPRHRASVLTATPGCGTSPASRRGRSCRPTCFWDWTPVRERMPVMALLQPPTLAVGLHVGRAALIRVATLALQRHGRRSIRRGCRGLALAGWTLLTDDLPTDPAPSSASAILGLAVAGRRSAATHVVAASTRSRGCVERSVAILEECWRPSFVRPCPKLPACAATSTPQLLHTAAPAPDCPPRSSPAEIVTGPQDREQRDDLSRQLRIALSRWRGL